MVMRWLSERSRQPELMDQPGLDFHEHHRALRGLERVNQWSGTVGSIWKPIAKLASQREQPVRVLDVACGGGDTAIGLWKLSRRSDYRIEVDGCDISETAISYAQHRAVALNAQVRFFTADAIGGGLPEGYDVICCSLFLHHLDPPELIALLEAMGRRAVCMIVISDLLRSRLGYILCWAGIRLLTRSHICHVDGPLSVRAAFTIPELSELFESAGLTGVEFQRRWPERCLMTWMRQ